VFSLPRDFSPAVMNDPHSQQDSSLSKTESGFLFDDWKTDENGSNDSATLFDGKIIARMPDLGSESIAKTVAKTVEKPQFPSFWGELGTSVLSVFQGGTNGSASANPRQQFFQRVTAIGAVVLLCGFGILFIGSGDDEAIDYSINVVGTAKPSTTEAGSFFNHPGVKDSGLKDSGLFARQPEPTNDLFGGNTHSAIPVAPVESVVAVSPQVSPQVSPWDRPAANSFSPQTDPQPNQPGNPFQPIDLAHAHHVSHAPPIPPNTVAMSPMTPIGTPSTAAVPSGTVVMPSGTTAMPFGTATMPVSPHEISVSPHEALPLVAQSNHPTVPPGMMPMQGRQENMPGGASPHHNLPHHGSQHPSSQHPNPQWQTSAPPPWQTSASQHSPHPHSMHGHAAPVNHPHQGQQGHQGQGHQGQWHQQGHQGQGQFGPHHQQFNQQFVYPPGYMVPSHHATPAGMPIPTGVSTLPQQGGQSMPPPHGMPMQNMPPLGTPPMSRPPSDFHNPPPSSRWM
jgi:hypothetical protein